MTDIVSVPVGTTGAEVDLSVSLGKITLAASYPIEAVLNSVLDALAAKVPALLPMELMLKAAIDAYLEAK